MTKLLDPIDFKDIPPRQHPPKLTDHERAKQALEYIPADNREEWVKIGMAIKALRGDRGEDLFHEWSSTAGNYNERDAADVWRSIDSDGGIGPGTLFHYAREYGFTGSTYVPPRQLTPEEVEARRQAKAKQEAKEKQDQKRAKDWAARIMEKSRPAEKHPYLDRKQVAPLEGARAISADRAKSILGYELKAKGEPLQGELLVIEARRIGSDKPCTLEFIDPNGRKTALAGKGTKTGVYWATMSLDSPDKLLVGEGVATCLSASQGANIPAVAALSNSNMGRVAEDMRKLYPGAEITILADLDTQTGQPDQSAIKAAQAVGGFLALPDFGPDREPGHKDFNDLAVVHGLERVKECIEKAQKVTVNIWDSPADVFTMLTTPAPDMPCLIVDVRTDPPAPTMPLGRGGLLAGIGGSSKTQFCKQVALGVVLGSWALDNVWQIETTGKAVLVLTEDTAEDVHASLAYIASQFTEDEARAIADNLIIYPLAGQDVRLLQKTPTGTLEKSPLFYSLVQKIKDIGGVVFVALDPALGLSDGEEMSQADQRALGKMADDLAVQTGATCILVAHASKGTLASEELSSHSARGGGAITDAGRFEFTIRTMTSKEAQAYRIEDLEERKSLVQVAATKANRLPPAAQVPVWLRRGFGGVLYPADLKEPERKSQGKYGLKQGGAVVWEALRQAILEHGELGEQDLFQGIHEKLVRDMHKTLYFQQKPGNSPRAEGQNWSRGMEELAKEDWIIIDPETRIIRYTELQKTQTEIMTDAIRARHEERNKEQDGTKGNNCSSLSE
ncbi:hypothetical protein MASR1M90_23900 [Desulfovibrionales bacterium]